MKTALPSARLRFLLVLVSAIAILPANLSGQEAIDGKLFSGMQWRLIGPFRGGRVTAVAGATDANTYYFGTPGGGVWKTTDGGQVWQPIFDQTRVASIGALTVAPSDSNVLYVGTGEQTRGNGVYRSADAGTTWKNVGLQDVPFIQAIVVDPKNPDVVYSTSIVTMKSTDGGKTWVSFRGAPGGDDYQNIWIEGIGSGITVLDHSNRMPVTERDLAVIAAARDAHGSTFLLSAANPIRKGIGNADVIKLRCGLVVP